MSETSQSVGRIAVLTAFTLLFAAAWRGDAPESSRPATIVAWSKRGSAVHDEREPSGAIVEGLACARPVAVIPSQRTGQHLLAGARRILPRTGRSALLFFKKSPALGRVMPPSMETPASTAAAGSGVVR